MEVKQKIEKVDIVQVENGEEWEPETHFAVEKENSGALLYECSTQAAAISWATLNEYTVNIHRVRNRKDGDQHGQFRKK